MTKHHERAFPLHPGILPEWQDNAGMTKREHFAGLVAQGFAVNMTKSYVIQSPADVAKYAVEVADALIAELAKGGEA